MFEQLLANIPADAKRHFGEELRAIAACILAQVERAEADARALTARRERTRRARDAALAAARAVERGAAPLAAAEEIAAARGLDAVQVRAWLEIERKKARGRARLRNRQMMRLAARGWSDREIGRKFKLHPKSVNRILRRMLRTNPPMAAHSPPG